MKQKIFTLLCTIFFIGGVLLLSSCENFMHGSDVRNELKEAIEAANSKKITYFVSVDEGSGEANPSSVFVRKNDSFDLLFTPASDWRFLYWEAIDKETGETLPDAIKFESADKPQTKAQVNNPGENVLIHPKCVQVPTIISVEPKTQAYANTPIIIKFNIPVEAKETSQKESIFNLTNIVLTCNGNNISDLFEAPVFNENKTELTIFPKSNIEQGLLLKNYIINDLNVGSIEIQVSFNDAIKIINDDIEFNLKDEKYSVYYIPTTDSQSPTKYKLIVSRDSSLSLENGESFTGNVFHKEDITLINGSSLEEDSEEYTNYKQLVFNNACDGTVYIYGRYFDNGSGVKSVVVNEVMTHNICGNAITNADPFNTEYTKDSPEAIFKTINNETVFIIAHTIRSKEKNEDVDYGGAVSFDISINDYCYNSTEEEHYIIIPCWNIHYCGYTIEAGYEDSIIGLSNWVDYSSYYNSLQNHIKSVYYNFEYAAYDVYGYAGHDKNTLFLELQILDKKNPDNTKHLQPKYEPRIPDPFNDDFFDLTVTFDLDDYVILPDTVIKLVMTDFLGHVNESVVQDFSASSEIIIPNIYEKESKKYVNFYKSNGYLFGGGLLTRKDSSNNIQCISNFNNDIVLEPGYTYGLIINGLLYQNCSFTVDNTALQRPAEIQIDKIDIKKSEKKGYLTVTAELNKASLIGFDNICYKYLSSSYKKVSEGATSISVEIPDSYMHGGIYTADGKYKVFTVYGFKDNMRTNGTDCEINVYNSTEAPNVEQAIKNQYDNTAPTFLFKMKGSSIEIKMRDDWSGIKEGAVEIKGKTYTFNSANDTRKIPMWQVLDSANDYSYIHFTGEDKAGNKTDELELTKKCIDPRYSKLVFEDGNITIKSSSYCQHCMGYNFNEDLSSNNYGFPSEFEISGNGIDKSYFFDKTSSQYVGATFTNNTYIKIIPYYYASNYYLANPLYYYNGTPGNQENDFLIPNGNSKESVVIGSDKPVYVHTVATWQPLSECKNWDYPEWEYYKQEYGEKILDCETSPIKVYTIPLKEIESGQNYIVIAHYSNNNVLMSEVMTK